MNDIVYWVIVATLPMVLGIKWLRVAQREHYVGGWTRRVALAWGTARPVSWWPIIAAAVIDRTSVV